MQPLRGYGSIQDGLSEIGKSLQETGKIMVLSNPKH